MTENTAQPKFEFEIGQQVASFSETVWHEYGPLAAKFGAVNLGQGFPNWQPPQFVLDAATEALNGHVHAPSTSAPNVINQYTRSGGHMSLVNAITKFYSPKFGREINPMTEVVTTAGATEGLFAAIVSLVSPGDEVILFEPFFDIYIGAVTMARGVPKYLPLRRKVTDPSNPTSADFVFDVEELKALMSPKTKMIVINSPHNPTGKVFSEEELTTIANVVKAHPKCIVVSDEVYEWLVYEPAKHIRIGTMPGMFERTLSVYSAGKTFSVTGWKIGWLIGGAQLISAVMRAHQFLVFSIATALQEAVSTALAEAEKRNYLVELKEMYLKKREFLFNALKDAGLNPIMPQGSFFIMADVSKIKLRPDQGLDNITGLCMDVHDWKVARWLAKEIGVAGIPASAFYSEENPMTDLVRFAFCKTDDQLELAKKNFTKLQTK